MGNSIRRIQLIDMKRFMDLMQVLGLNKVINSFIMTNGMLWYGHVLRREVSYVLRCALEL